MLKEFIAGVLVGALVCAWVAIALAAIKKDTLPPCPGAVISAEYHKDGVMLCRYQQEPIGMKTYKEKQQVK